MKDIMPENGLTIAERQESTRKTRWYKRKRCSICTSSIWFRPIVLREPPGAPEPRRIWTLCHHCHDLLLKEMRRSPVRSPLRLRIALGIVASEHSPSAYHVSTHVRDQRLFLGIAWVLIIAMLLHLVVILYLVALTR